MSDDLHLDMAKLHALGRLAEPHGHALLTAIRAEYGDEAAPTLYPVALFMLAGAVLKTVSHAERAPDGIAQVWSIMDVPFSLEAKRLIA